MRTAPLQRSSGKARATAPVPRARKCKACHGLFTPVRPLQRACNFICAMDLVKAANAAAERKADRAKREKLKPRSKWLQEAQAAFNKFIRMRDAALPCVSCLRFHEGKWNAGHYLSTGARPELRFCETNVHRQCEPCNTHLHGNLVLYRAELIRREGLAEVERLEGPHAPRKYTVGALKEIRDTYRKRLSQKNSPSAPDATAPQEKSLFGPQGAAGIAISTGV